MPLTRFLIGFASAALLALVGAGRPAQAQSLVTGTVVDASSEETLPGVNVVATRLAGDSTRTGTATDLAGTFRLRLAPGRYRLRLSFVGYLADIQTLAVGEEPTALGTVRLLPDVFALDEVIVEAQRDPVRVRGDTTVFSAEAFAVTAGASVEDLVAKMPGIVVQDGTVQAQGEEVLRVLVDGEEFFGSDAIAALRNLPAEIVRDVEVYDRQSDQARFTGFDDGNAERTINVVTRPDRRHGQFGQAVAGAGPGAHYLARGAANVFDGDRRLTVTALTNDVDQQNFASADLLGAMNGGPPGGGSPGSGGADDSDGYLLGDQDGINATTALGVNYSDRWSEDVRLNGSYFFNTTGADTDALLERTYFRTDAANQTYAETSDANGRNTNHRLDMRLEAALSDATELTVRPRLSVQHNTSESLQSSLSALTTGTPLSESTTDATDDATAYDGEADVLLRRRLSTDGRTISARLGVALDGQRGDTQQDVTRLFYGNATATADSTDAYARTIDDESWGRTLSANVAYTEPAGANGLVQLTYNPSFARGGADQDTFRQDEATGDYTVVDSAYTGASDRRVVTQRGGLSYQYRRGRDFYATAGLDVQHERLSFAQDGLRAFDVDRSFLALLPSARLRADLPGELSLDASYRARTTTPGVRDLRDVIDDTNPLLVTIGNPDLQTSTSHQLRFRLRGARPGDGAFFFGGASLTAARDYVGTAAFVAEGDTTQVRGVTLAPGAQLSYPVNLGGYWRARTHATYGRPVGVLSSNASADVGLAYTRTPSRINDVDNLARTLQADARLSLTSNVSERLDFSLRYGATYSHVTNTSAQATDDTYLRHRPNAEVEWLPWKGLVLSSDLDLSLYTGLSSSIDPSAARWNAGVGYKFLENDAAEVRLTGYDLLNQTNDVRRTVTGTYVEDRETQSLGRYLMLTFTYRLRRFGNG